MAEEEKTIEKIDMSQVDVSKKATEIKPEQGGKVFSEEYVQSLREEAKSHRLIKKQREAQLRTVLGLKDDEEVTEAAIAAYKQTTEAQIQSAQAKANDRLILAAIRSMTEYDTKLLERLVDKSKLTITDNGDVEGLNEAIEALLTEFPQIKKSDTASGVTGVNPKNGAPGSKTVEDEYKETLELIKQSPGDRALMQKLFLIKERMKN